MSVETVGRPVSWKCAARVCSDMSGRKAKAAAAQVDTAVDSSDEEVEQRVKHTRQPKAVFSKKAIHDAVFGTAASAVRTHVPSFLSPAVTADWDVWLQRTPEALAEVPAVARPLPMQMPMKCRPQAAEEQEARPTAEQVDLITYRNPDGTGSLSAGERSYDARQTTLLLEGFVDINSVVVVKRPVEHEAQVEGFRTAFYLGKVLRVHYRSATAEGSTSAAAEGSTSAAAAATDSTSTAPTKRVIEALDVHWCYPFFNGKPCDDVKRPWKLACCAMHAWDKLCETRNACKEMRRPELGDTSREWSRVDAQTVQEMNISMTPATNALTAASKEKLAMHSDAWATALGVQKNAQRKARPRKK